jgi:hypothetical protein
MLVLTVPHVFSGWWEPEMNNGLVMNVNINLKSIREYMMSVVLVAPPPRTESKKELTENFIKEEACLSSTVAVIMSEPSSLFNSEPKKQGSYHRVRS